MSVPMVTHYVGSKPKKGKKIVKPKPPKKQ
jgi:hypothetical protein